MRTSKDRIRKTKNKGWFAMSNSGVRIRFDGPVLENHSMDVADLAPSLLALADLCKSANKKFNGERAAVKVMVNADVEQNCFELYLELAMSLFDAAKTIIANDEVKNAKEILEWIGILSCPIVGGIGLIKLSKAISNKKISKTELTQIDGQDMTQITIKGDNNHVQVVRTPPEVFEMLKDSANVKNVRKLVEPLKNEGYETLEFETENKEKETLSKEDAGEILKCREEDISESLEDHEEPQKFTAWLKAYSPVYSIEAQNWRFVMGEQHITVDISGTDIATKALERGGVFVDDRYKVVLSMTQSKQTGRAKYAIEEVLEFIPATPDNSKQLPIHDNTDDNT